MTRPTYAELIAALDGAADTIESHIEVHIYDDDEPADAPVRRYVAELRALIQRAGAPEAQ